MINIRSWPSPAKLNLFLHIIGRRSDKYHKLQTLFHFINYGDFIKIIPTYDGKIRLLNPIFGIKNKNNLILKAAKLLQVYCFSKRKNKYGAFIYINKVLPIGSGLGGGSSNAATVLIALNKIWRTKLSIKKLIEIGLILGTDVPAFIFGHTSIVEGIGEILTPIYYPKKWYLVLILPINISTQLIFNIPKLKRNSPNYSIEHLLNEPFYNDFEPIVKEKFPVIDKCLKWLSKYSDARLTGTGSCIFAEFDDKNYANKIQKLVPSWIDSFVAQGVNMSPLYNGCYYE